MQSLPEIDGAIAQQEDLVRKAYCNGGMSKKYRIEFDRLHDMRMNRMAITYRQNRGLPLTSKTPYCS